MDAEAMFVRPSDVFSSSHTEMDLKSPVNPPPNMWESDDKFHRYASSPESMNSYGDDNLFSPIDEDQHANATRLLDLVRQSLSPYQDQLDTKITFPITLDPLQASLVSTYLTDYSEAVYGFTPYLRPHPMALILSMSMSMTNPAAFHLVLARSAQYRLSWTKFQSDMQRREFELAVMRHKGEAMQIIRNLSQQVSHGQLTEDLMAAIIGLGVLDRVSGAGETAAMHFGAVNQLLKSMGGPLHIQSPWLSRLMVHFECGYGATTQSYAWDKSDFTRLHTDLNQFFYKIWSSQRAPGSPYPVSRRNSMERMSPQSPSEPMLIPGLRLHSALYNCLSQRRGDVACPTQQDRLELIFQITCLLILCTIMVDHRSDPPALQAYIDSVHKVIAGAQLQGQPISNVMWLLQVHDLSHMHSQRIWTVAGWVWVLRHVNFNVQNMVKDWLVAVLTGRSVSKPLKLDSFAFSYAS